jgi:hypothetical protein
VTCGRHPQSKEARPEWVKGDAGQRALLGLLNKVSAQNISAMRAKIISCVSRSSLDVETVSSALLNKCYHEDCYAHLYTRLLLEVMGTSCEARNVVYDLAMAFVHEFLHSPCVRAVDDTKVDDYDAFCAMVKTKKLAIGKNRAIIELLRNDVLHTISPEAYYTALLRRLSATSDGSDADLELHLDFITDFARSFREVPDAESLRAALARDVGSLSPKCRFKLQDIAEACKPAAHALKVR